MSREMKSENTRGRRKVTCEDGRKTRFQLVDMSVRFRRFPLFLPVTTLADLMIPPGDFKPFQNMPQ